MYKSPPIPVFYLIAFGDGSFVTVSQILDTAGDIPIMLYNRLVPLPFVLKIGTSI
jgi:hypothetical protein